MNFLSKIALLALIFIFVLPSRQAAGSSPARTFYIAPSGDDENSGTKEHPHATLERAVRAAGESGGPSVIYLRQGYYPLNHTIVLRDIDSLVVRSLPGEQAHVIGGLEISGFYALNLVQELDFPGEWYLDRETGVLYFGPPSDTDKARVFVSLLQAPMVSLNNTRNVTLQDLVFEYTCGAGVEIVGGRDNAIKDCILLNVGTVAASIGKLIDNPGDYRRRAATADVAGRSSVVWKEIHVGEKKGVIN